MKSTQKALELARFACEEPFCLIESKTEVNPESWTQLKGSNET